MILKKMLKFTISLLSLCFTTVCLGASPYTIIAPNCLIKQLSGQYEILSKQNNILLVQMNDKSFQKLLALKQKPTPGCGHFFNVTDQYQKNRTHLTATNFLKNYAKQTFSATPPAYHIQHEKTVNTLLANFSGENLWQDLTNLSDFPDRYAGSDNGVKAANWLKTQVEAIAKQNGRTDVTTFFIPTGKYYKQPSLVIKIGDGNAPGIVIGAHMDTLSGLFNKMPGADDDGTGSVTVLSTARVLLSNQLHFKKPVYLIWYAAEEMGLVGSQYVVEEFKNKNIPVESVIHFDMTGYANHNDLTMWLLDDNTNPALTNFLSELIQTYVKKPIKHTTCGYACSDHATWTSNGYAAAIAFEAEDGKYNPYIHTALDVMSNLNLEHMTDYAKLAIAFAVETAEPV